MADLYCRIEKIDITGALGYDASLNAVRTPANKSIKANLVGCLVTFYVRVDLGFGETEEIDRATIRYDGSPYYDTGNGRLYLTLVDADGGETPSEVGYQSLTATGDYDSMDYPDEPTFSSVTVANGLAVYGKLPIPTFSKETYIEQIGSVGAMARIKLSISGSVGEFGETPDFWLIRIDGDGLPKYVGQTLDSFSIPAYPWKAEYRIKAVKGGSIGREVYSAEKCPGLLTEGYIAGEQDSDWSEAFSIDGSLATPAIAAAINPIRVSWGRVVNAELMQVDSSINTLKVDASIGGVQLKDGELATVKALSADYGFGRKESAIAGPVGATIAAVGKASIAWSGEMKATVALPDHSQNAAIYVGGEFVMNASGEFGVPAPASAGSSEITAVANPDNSSEQSETGLTLFYGLRGEPSDPLALKAIKLATPALDQSSGRFFWEPIANAKDYSVYLSGALVSTTEETEYSPTADNGDVYVIANPIGFSYEGAQGTYYLASDKSASIGFGTLETPTLTAEANVLSWQAVENATSYAIIEDGEEIASTTGTSYSARETEPGTRVFSIRADSTLPTLIPSDLSNEVSITWGQLPKPSLSSSDGGKQVIVFGQYPVGSTIAIDVNWQRLEKESDGSGEAIFDLGSYSFIGENIIRARAFSDDPLTLPSPQSDRLYFFKEGSPNYCRAYIAGKEYRVQLPVSLTITADGTLDVGSITLSIEDTADMREPLEAAQRVVLINYGEDGQEKKRWTMEISADKVTAKQYGQSYKYLHELTLIEITKDTQALIVPDTTATQPLSLAGKLFSEVKGSRKGKLCWENSRGYGEFHKTPFEEGPYSYKTWRVFPSADEAGTGAYSLITSNRLQNKVAVDYATMLPDWVIPGVCVAEYSTWAVVPYQYFKGKYDEKKIYHPVKRWYIRKMADGEGEWDYDEFKKHVDSGEGFVAIYSDDSPTSEVIHKFAEEGQYRIYLTADPIYDGRIGGEAGIEPNIIGLDNVLGPSPDNFSDTVLGDFFMTWKLEAIGGSPEEVIDKNAVTIGQELDHLLIAMRPLRIDDGVVDNPKYRWSLPGHASEVCDELTWSGGKTLYECLEDLGRQFGGIPRLQPDGTITYDIVGETCVGNPLYVSEGGPTEGESTIDNHASALVCQAKNSVSDDHWEVYPGEGRWAALKSSDDSSPYVTRSNACIKLPHPIYQLYQIECKDLKNGGEYMIFRAGFVEMCLESALWGLLPETKEGKGSSLVYTRGDDKILNVGAISPATLTDEIFGLQPDQYVIGNILSILAGDSAGLKPEDVDPNQLLFRVTYRPYIDEVITAEQADQSTERAHTAIAFNQDASVVSDRRLGAVMEGKAERLGNNSFTQLSRVPDVASAPAIGQTAVVNGETYYANKINLLIERTYVEATVQYTKNRNNIDPRVGVACEYRQYEIYADNYVTRQITTDCYAVVSLKKFEGELTDDGVSQGAAYGVLDAIEGFFNGAPLDRPTDFYVTVAGVSLSKSFKNSSDSSEYLFGEPSLPTPRLDSPVIKATLSYLRYTPYGSEFKRNIDYGYALHAEFKVVGNSVTFYAEAKDNYSMGTSATQQETQQDPLAIGGTGKYIVRDVRYVDDYGECGAVRVALGRINNNALLWNPKTLGEQKEYDADLVIGRRLPLAEYSTVPALYMEKKGMLMSATFLVDKDNREKLAFQYALHFVSFDPTIKVRPALASRLYASDPTTILACLLYKDPMGAASLPESYIEILDSKVSAETTFGQVKVDVEGEITPDRDAWGWALVANDGSLRPMIVVRQAITAGEAITLPTIWIGVNDSLPEWREK